MRRIFIFATLALALAAAASAQTAGRITGTIKDPDGKPIKGATVRATNDAVNAQITSTTDDKGRFAMIGVRTGRWSIVAEAPNFLRLQGASDVSSSNMPVLALTLQRDPGPMPGALAKTISEDVAAAETLRKAGRYDDAIAAYQSIQSKNTRLTTVNMMLATLYREKATQEKDATLAIGHDCRGTRHEGVGLGGIGLVVVVGTGHRHASRLGKRTSWLTGRWDSSQIWSNCSRKLAKRPYGPSLRMCSAGCWKPWAR